MSCQVERGCGRGDRKDYGSSYPKNCTFARIVSNLKFPKNFIAMKVSILIALWGMKIETLEESNILDELLIQ